MTGLDQLPSPPPRHAETPQFRMCGHQLCVGDQDLSLLATGFGPTPPCAYDRSLLRERVATVRAAPASGVKLHYGMKADPMPVLVGFMTGLIKGLDEASAGELKIVVDAGAGPQQIGFTGPGKRDAELRQAVACHVLVDLESMRQVHVLASIPADLGQPARIGDPLVECQSGAYGASTSPQAFLAHPPCIAVLV